MPIANIPLRVHLHVLLVWDNEKATGLLLFEQRLLVRHSQSVQYKAHAIAKHQLTSTNSFSIYSTVHYSTFVLLYSYIKCKF